MACWGTHSPGASGFLPWRGTRRFMQSICWELAFPIAARSLTALSKQRAQRLLQFMDKTGVASCDLLGTSHGGAVSMFAASLAPDRIRKLILVDPVNPWSAHGKRLTAFLSNPLIAPLFATFTPHARSLQEFYHRRMFGDPQRIPPDSLKGYRKPMRIPGSYDYALSVVRSWNRDLEELESALPRIANIPTLLTWGTKDTAVDPASAAQLKGYFRDCRLVMFEGVGHPPVRRSARGIQSRGDRIPGTRVSLMHSLAGANLEARNPQMKPANIAQHSADSESLPFPAPRYSRGLGTFSAGDCGIGPGFRGCAFFYCFERVGKFVGDCFVGLHSIGAGSYRGIDYGAVSCPQGGRSRASATLSISTLRKLESYTWPS